MNAPVQRSLLLPAIAAASISEIRATLRAADDREQERRAAAQRAAIARRLALADLIEARPE